MKNKLFIELMERGRTYELYRVVGDIDEISNSDLIDLCDINNFGGSVCRGTNGATVKVYID